MAYGEKGSRELIVDPRLLTKAVQSLRSEERARTDFYFDSDMSKKGPALRILPYH